MTQPPPDQRVQATSQTDGNTSNGVDADLRRLIRKAFEVARQTDREDWQQMSVAVLKNRLLDITDRTFNERDYGARSIGELVRKVPDMLLVYENTRPLLVKLLSTESPTDESLPTDDSRIRSDLWRAVIDYRSGQRYVWNGSVAVPQPEVTTVDPGGYILPTITAEVMDGWRTGFMESSRALINENQELQAQLERWRAERLPARELPDFLRGRWSAELKRQVSKNLTEWFSDLSIPVPSDLVQPLRHGKGRPGDIATSALRELVMRCVRIMTDEELRELRLPPAAVLRAIQ